MIAGAVLAGILTGLFIQISLDSATVVQAKSEEVIEEPEEVRIEVVIDWTKERIEEEIRTVFHEEPNTAVAIAKCESGLKADIQSHHILSYGREQSFGVFQIHAKDHEGTANRLGLEDYRTDVKDNVQMARFLYDNRGNFNDWTCFKSGEYKRYL